MKKLKTSSKVIPMFPLPIVAFPTALIPLHIFEERYKKMIADIQQGDGKFGIVRADTRTVSLVGSIVELIDVEALNDGRMNIVTRGTCRFSVDEFYERKPYGEAKVKLLVEDEETPESHSLAEQVRTAVLDIFRLSGKLDDSEYAPPDDMPTDAVDLSFWVPSRIYGSLYEQQKLLELDGATIRLQSEYSRLDAIRKNLAARTAIKDAF